MAFKRNIIDLRSASTRNAERPSRKAQPTTSEVAPAEKSARDDGRRDDGQRARRDDEAPRRRRRRKNTKSRSQGSKSPGSSASATPRPVALPPVSVARRRRVVDPSLIRKEPPKETGATTAGGATEGEASDDTSFADLGLLSELMRALDEVGYSTPTPIQGQAIPGLLAGKDMLGIAQTGTGKTAAFTLPVLQHLATHDGRRSNKRPRALVLTPTRELAIQIGESFGAYGKHLRRLRHTVIFGGVNQNAQVRAMRSGVDILVATPGRLLDLIGQGFIVLDRVEFFVLDEADRMLDMGFIHDVKKVLHLLPSEQDRQTLLFSATMPDTVAKLAETMMRDYLRIEVTPAATTVERIDQTMMFVEKSDKRSLLGELLADPAFSRALIFSRTKHGANRIVQFLDKIGVTAAAIHGNKSQNARQRALAAFQQGRVRALVATDIAARGIDVHQVTHVVNFDLPNEPESYVHRIGRTARAGCEGVAISFCMRDELDYLRDIEKLIKQKIAVVQDHPYHAQHIRDDYLAGKRGSVKQGGGGRRGGDRNRGRGGQSRGGRGGHSSGGRWR